MQFPFQHSCFQRHTLRPLTEWDARLLLFQYNFGAQLLVIESNLHGGSDSAASVSSPLVVSKLEWLRFNQRELSISKTECKSNYRIVRWKSCRRMEQKKIGNSSFVHSTKVGSSPQMRNFSEKNYSIKQLAQRLHLLTILDRMKMCEQWTNFK